MVSSIVKLTHIYPFPSYQVSSRTDQNESPQDESPQDESDKENMSGFYSGNLTPGRERDCNIQASLMSPLPSNQQSNCSFSPAAYFAYHNSTPSQNHSAASENAKENSNPTHSLQRIIRLTLSSTVRIIITVSITSLSHASKNQSTVVYSSNARSY